MYIVDGLKQNILYDGSVVEGMQNVLYAGTDKKPSTSSDEYAEVQRPNAVYAQVDPKTQQKNLKAKKQKGEVLKLILICIYTVIRSPLLSGQLSDTLK